MRFLISCFGLVMMAASAMAQLNSSRGASYDAVRKVASPLAGVPFRNIGPTIMSGRVTDIEVNPKNTREFYVAYASGGVWHTSNNGQSFEPIFDKEAVHTIGDMAMNWETRTLWVGTGEVNSSRSSYAGNGIYRSGDNGKTWTYLGLEESHHIGRIVLHPSNPNIAWVAVLGHLYTTNPERGIYKTNDNGKTWQQTLFVNDSTGCVDLVIDPSNPEVLYAAAWTRTRKAWQFNGNGEQSGIYKSTDGGNRFQLISDSSSGFPHNKGVGRVGLAVCANQPNVLYALLDNQNNQAKKVGEEKKLNAKDLAQISQSDFLLLPKEKLEDYLKSNGYPKKYTYDSLIKAVKNNVFTVADIAEWKLADADANLYNSPVIGAELYRSNDAGKTWQKTHEKILEGVYFTYGYYFGTVSVSPVNPDKVFIAGYPLLGSADGGKTFRSLDGDNCHPDYHRVWVDALDDTHLITGNDGGINISYDGGAHWIKANNPAVGQFYAVQVDNDKPYNVYGGLQDNGTWTASSTTKENTAWHQDGSYPYKALGGGDGMQVQVDSRDNTTTYIGYQFGNYFKVNKQTGDMTSIDVVHDIGKKPYRFNWQTPILLSKHHEDIFYLGSNRVHRSLHQGVNMEAVSEDLTAHDKKGNIPFGTLTSLSESPLQFGLLYSGSDDGLIHCSNNVGTTWNNISAGLPQQLWVSRVLASLHQKARVYVSLNGYRNDDFTAYVYCSNDYGAHWKRLGTDLPLEPVNVIREDPKDERILYVGTDNGLYVSFDGGAHFMAWTGSLPRVAIHDMVIQARENELVLGTHGRSIYIAKLDLVQAYNQVKDSALVLFDIKEVRYNKNLGRLGAVYERPDSMDMAMDYFVKEGGAYTFRVLNEKGLELNRMEHRALNGFNTAHYNLGVASDKINAFKPALKSAEDGKYYLIPGKYMVSISGVNGAVLAKKELVVKEKEKK